MVQKLLHEARKADREIDLLCESEREEDWKVINQANIYDAVVATSALDTFDDGIISKHREFTGEALNIYDARVLVRHRNLEFYKDSRHTATVAWQNIVTEAEIMENLRKELTEYQSAREQAQMAFEQVLSRGGDKAEAEAPVGQDAKAEVPVGAPDVQYTTVHPVYLYLEND
ncbi:hypothetical protein BT96DRAFT_1005410 [Gymnopus androsaceus JB14]|uniref:Uncharacterized protein n=1 Tax=Gymnopus androsaceus JB14 TaxID=1447944 RepID=A0A6A4GP92_9AGAR|nr:hypothetical protein BT96DRAFT_1005410 [Gymnopus androsaceus JB14]